MVQTSKYPLGVVYIFAHP